MTRARVALTVVFALNGVLFASIFARLPAIKERTGLSAGALGAALLFSMFGLLASQLIAGQLVARAGSRPLVLVGALGYAVGLVPVALARSFTGLVAALLVVGFANGLLDVAMNVHGITLERRIERPILSSLHAFFSFGALAGAGIGGFVAGADVGVVPHLSVMAGVGVAIGIVASRFLLPPEADAVEEGPRFARPDRALLVVGAFAFCALLSEGAVADWAAVYLNEELGTGEGLAAGGLAAFSLAMAVGRLAGDPLTELAGARRLGLAGGALGASGLALAVLADAPGVAIAGFGVAGFGLAALFPLAVRAASELGETPASAVAAVSAVGYCGFLAGPPAVGGLAEAGGLRLGLSFVVALATLAALLATVALRGPVRAR